MKCASRAAFLSAVEIVGAVGARHSKKCFSQHHTHQQSLSAAFWSNHPDCRASSGGWQTTLDHIRQPPHQEKKGQRQEVLVAAGHVNSLPIASQRAPSESASRTLPRVISATSSRR